MSIPTPPRFPTLPISSFFTQPSSLVTKSQLVDYSEYIAKELSNLNLNKNNMTKQDVMNSLIDAITASGKKFTEIKKEAILAFLKQEGIPNNQWESIYGDLSNIYRKSNLHQGHVSPQTQSGVDIQPKEVFDYLNTTHNDVKQRQPRKSIFSEIKKIAG